MTKLLSVKQFAALSLGQEKPPWHLGYLNWLYNQTSISLKSSIEALSSTQTVVFVQPGTYDGLLKSDAPAGSTRDQCFNCGWLDTSWTIQELAPLSAIVQEAGVVISFAGFADEMLDPAEDGFYPVFAIGLAGTFADLASLNVTQVPAYPSAWNDADTAIATNASFLLNEVSGTTNFVEYFSQRDDPTGATRTSPNPYALPLAALSPGQSSDMVGTGLLGIVGLNRGVNATQFQISIFATIRNFLLGVLTSSYTVPLPQSIEAIGALIASHRAWVQNALKTVLVDVPDVSQFAVQAGTPALNTSAVTYFLDDGTSFTTSALTVNSDGTVTGGIAS